MSRGKTVSDELLLNRLMTAMAACGPADLSFAKAANASGLSAATLVQRFRTRDGMVEAILLRAWDQLDEATIAADAWAPPGPAGAIEFLLRLTNSGAAEFDFTDGLLLLREDIQNPVLRARGAQWGLRLAQAIGRRLHEDDHRGLQLGWQMASLWQGALLWWAFCRDVRPEVRVREILEDWSRTAGLLPPRLQQRGQ